MGTREASVKVLLRQRPTTPWALLRLRTRGHQEALMDRLGLPDHHSLTPCHSRPLILHHHLPNSPSSRTLLTISSRHHQLQLAINTSHPSNPFLVSAWISCLRGMVRLFQWWFTSVFRLLIYLDWIKRVFTDCPAPHHIFRRSRPCLTMVSLITIVQSQTNIR